MASKTLRVRPGKDVLIDVDIQPAFMPGGGLAVEGGDRILPVVKRVHRHFVREQRFLTLDRHPKGHISLVSSYVGLKPYHELRLVWDTPDDGPARAIYDAPEGRFTPEQILDYLSKVEGNRQTIWPDHALIGSGEDVLHPALDPFDYVWAQIKGTDPLCDSYSGFRDNLRRQTGFAARIRMHAPAAERVFLTGLAYDYCVGWTALDAIEEGFEAVVIKDATRPVNLPGTVTDIEKRFAAKRVRVMQSSDLRS
ncbi:MAG TPA: isochorismatase family protein [Candidatus Baltobacteraceae bacterium]|nr:isochorismatase family protein [Candidatus Baltobacteraceae bacterium]